MEILHIISGPGGGIASYVFNLIEHKNITYNYTILSFESFSLELKKLANETETKLIVMPRPGEVGMIKFIIFLKLFFEENKFDFVVSHIPGVHSIIFKLLSSINNSKLFSVHSHQSRYVYGRKMNFSEKCINYINPYINTIVSTHKFACSKNAAVYGFSNSSNLTIIHNSIEVKKFFSHYNKKKKNEKIIIGHIGRHSAAKNLEFIIELGNFIKNSIYKDKLEIHLVGSGELSEWVKKEIISRELENIIFIKGRKHDIEKVFVSIDVLILPSYSEGLPTVLIEAQATGTPSVVSKSVTKEVDLNLSLISYLNIKKNVNTYEKWINEVINLNQKSKPQRDEVKKEICKHKFSTEQMVSSFEDTLRVILS